MSYDPKSTLWQEAVAEYRAEQSTESERDPNICSGCGEAAGPNETGDIAAGEICDWCVDQARLDAEADLAADEASYELACEQQENDRAECGLASWRYETPEDRNEG